jgi:hypothetical protein
MERAPIGMEGCEMHLVEGRREGWECDDRH